MIVDDSNILRRKIERMYDKAKFQLVATAANGKEAFTRFKKARPDVVTMDITMPEMGGIACIEALVEEDPEINILVISALSDKATGIKALQRGAKGFLCKPFTAMELTDALVEIMEP